MPGRNRAAARPTGRDPYVSRIVGPPPASDGAAELSDDSTRLLVLLGVFTVACLSVVLALVGAAAIDSWWALAGVLVVQAVMTAASFAGVAFVFSGRLRRRPDHRACANSCSYARVSGGLRSGPRR